MKSSLLKSLMVIGAVFMLIGCGSSSSSSDTPSNGGGNGDGPSSELPVDVQNAIAGPMSTLTQDMKDSITYMYSEEGLAYDVYMNIYKIQAVQQLQKIAENAEIRHIDAVNQLAIKYDLNMTQYPDTNIPYSVNGIGNGTYPVDTVQYLYNLLYSKGIQSEKDALEVGCMVEVVDIDDLDKFIGFAEASNAGDVLTVFNFLREGSYSHYWAFDEGLKNMGVTDGCCSLEPALGHNFCHPEYPQKEKGGDGQGGHGNK